MLKEVEDRLKTNARPYDHIAWYGVCGRCGSSRYLFHDELKRLGKGNYDDLRGVQVQCKGGRCVSRVMLKGRISNKRATHLNDIRRRET